MNEGIIGVLVLLGLCFFGYSLIWPFVSVNIGKSERIILGLAISLGLMPLLLFYGLLAGSRLGLFAPWILIVGATPGLVLWVLDFRQRNRLRAGPLAPSLPPLRPYYQIVLMSVIAFLLIEKVIFVMIQGFSFPNHFWDAVETWNYKARVLHFTGQIDFNPQSKSFLGGWKPHYPLGPSLFRAWMATLWGSWSEKAVALDSIVAYFLLFALIWIGLSRKIGRPKGFLFSYLAVSLPLMIHHAYAGYADLMLSLFFTGCLIYGYKYVISGDRLSGVASALFLVSSLFTKNEGLVLILPALAITLLLAIWQRRISVGSVCIYLGLVALLILPWVILKGFLGLSYNTSEEYSAFQLNLKGLAHLFRVLFLQGSFNLFGVFFILSTLLYFPVWWRTDLRFLAVPIFLFLGGIMSVFLLTRNYEFLENQLTINRTLMVFMPSYIYLVGLSTEMGLWNGSQKEAKDDRCQS